MLGTWLVPLLAAGLGDQLSSESCLDTTATTQVEAPAITLADRADQYWIRQGSSFRMDGCAAAQLVDANQGLLLFRDGGTATFYAGVLVPRTGTIATYFDDGVQSDVGIPRIGGRRPAYLSKVMAGLWIGSWHEGARSRIALFSRSADAAPPTTLMMVEGRVESVRSREASPDTRLSSLTLVRRLSPKAVIVDYMSWNEPPGVR
jgi:hypothetical protein